MTRGIAVLLAVGCALAFSSGCYFRKRAEMAQKAARAAEIEAQTAAAAVVAKAVIIDSESTSGDVEKKGDWPPGLGGNDWEDSCLYAFQGNGECKFIWRPNLPRAGRYRVSIWFGGDPNSDHATNSPFTVHYDGGKETHKIDQTTDSKGWKVLGIYEFKAGRSGHVELTNGANGNVVADGVRFEPVR